VTFKLFYFQTLAVELQQSTGEHKILNSTIEFFNEVLNSPRSTSFVTSLLHTPQLACPLLRLMTTAAVSIVFNCYNFEVQANSFWIGAV